MQEKLYALMARREKAASLPPDQQERFAGAIARLDADIAAARAWLGVDAEGVERAICEAVRKAALQPHEAARLAMDKVGAAMAGIDAAYLAGDAGALRGPGGLRGLADALRAAQEPNNLLDVM